MLHKHSHKKTKNERGMKVGFIISLLTLLGHGIHFGLMLLMPLFVLLNLPLPHALHNIKIPFIFTLLSIVWIIYYLFNYLLRKRLVVLWYPFLSKKK